MESMRGGRGRGGSRQRNAAHGIVTAIQQGVKPKTRAAAADFRGAAVASVEIDAKPRVSSYESWWDAPIAEVSSEASVNEPRKEYEEMIEKQRMVW